MSAELFERAVAAARAQQKDEARELFIQVVETDPQHEGAWMWLAGLMESIEDRIIACENVLTINPANEKVRTHLARLQSQQEASAAGKNRKEAAHLLQQARRAAERGDSQPAGENARKSVEKDPAYEEAWIFLAEISPNLDEQIAALEKALRLNPSNPETILALKQAHYLKANPLAAAARLEQLGKLDEALSFYQELAGKARNSKEFDHIYRHIVRIEGLQREKIRYVAPHSSILRLAFAWPLLYLSLALVQVGLNPFAHPLFYLWLGLPFVVLGSFLLSLAEVRSPHVIWRTLFDEHGDGSMFARLVTAAAGWFLILVPHILLVLDSLNRLRHFQIPPMPF